ncbi:MAG: hypothetical protein FWG64_07625 [Firmicutes bacterium]|nr:hypothetical protein [Bacillota bacterium]
MQNEKVYNLFGKQYYLNHSLLDYNNLRQDLQRKATEAQNEFDEHYKKFTDFDQILTNVEKIYYEVVETFVADCMDHLNRANIFSYNVDSLMQYHDDNFSDLLIFHNIIDTLHEQCAFMEDKMDDNTERAHDALDAVIDNAERINDVVRVVSKIIPPAKMVHTAVGAVTKIIPTEKMAHNVVDAVSKIATSLAASKTKKEMFNNPELFPALSNAVYEDCFNLNLSIVDILQKNGKNITIIPEETTHKAEYQFKQLNLNTPPADALAKMVEILEMDPYDSKYYEYLVEKFQDENCEVENLAENFGYLPNLQNFKFELAKRYFQTMRKSSLEESAESQPKLKEYCKQLGTPYKPLAKLLNQHMRTLATGYFIKLVDSNSTMQLTEDTTLETLKTLVPIFAKHLTDLNSCTETMQKLEEYCKPIGKVPRIIIEAVDERLQICKTEAADNFLNSLLTSEEMPETDLLDAESKLRDYCKQIEFSDSPAFVKIDKMIRTVSGREFTTRELAHKAREDKITLQNLIDNNPKAFRGDFLAIIAEINSGKFTAEITGLYEVLCQAQLSSFDAKLENARHYEQKKASGKKFTGLKNIFKDVSSALGGEKAWNELTQNGKYTLDLVGSDVKSDNIPPVVKPVIISDFPSVEYSVPVADFEPVENFAPVVNSVPIADFTIINDILLNTIEPLVEEYSITSNETVDIVKQLQKLNELKESKIIDEDDFTLIKAKLLAKL